MNNISKTSVNLVSGSEISTEINNQTNLQKDVSQYAGTNFFNSGTSDEFVSSRKLLNNKTYNALTSSSASQSYENTTAASASSGFKLSKINLAAKSDFAYFNTFNSDSSGYSDLKYFAEAAGNKRITSLIKEFETTSKLLGISGEEVFENC